MNQPQVWDAYSKSYHNIEKNPAGFQFSLLNMLRLNEADEQTILQQTRILDAGCAGGHLHQYILQQRKQKCRLTAFDFSLEMTKIAAARMIKYFNNPLHGQIEDISPQEIENADISIFETHHIDCPLLEKNNYKIFQGDVQSLPQLNENQFDIYISNLVLQLVGNKDQAVQEAFRIIKPGGKIGIVIPVVQGNAPMLSLQQCFIKAGLIPNNAYKPTELENREGLINFMNKHGFKDIICWNQTIPFDLLDIDNNYIFPQFREILEKAPKEQVDQFYALFKQEIQNRLTQNLPFTVEALSLIAKKPL
ncbi:unnamed protein product (macronuclear) [Paramecium tetraurelia]|uniref:Methyltransferase type 11 domain-containing protein n=1 Tax=Paramecium tetraurelia TaxID=5888 RepID=A0DQ98_PARTE|nr:uncharacterized protein GSPATT00002615001 [Paramecium tetraurelia]CAK85215.1 unnamed protein product [Paramecium tetraurelia]|eukprot:XP_001452612.1 hypothetical protein (macronuclear) [Paramecium tetraurelia strain d4-2]